MNKRNNNKIFRRHFHTNGKKLRQMGGLRAEAWVVGQSGWWVAIVNRCKEKVMGNVSSEWPEIPTETRKARWVDRVGWLLCLWLLYKFKRQITATLHCVEVNVVIPVALTTFGACVRTYNIYFTVYLYKFICNLISIVCGFCGCVLRVNEISERSARGVGAWYTDFASGLIMVVIYIVTHIALQTYLYLQIWRNSSKFLVIFLALTNSQPSV